MGKSREHQSPFGSIMVIIVVYPSTCRKSYTAPHTLRHPSSSKKVIHLHQSLSRLFTYKMVNQSITCIPQPHKRTPHDQPQQSGKAVQHSYTLPSGRNHYRPLTALICFVKQQNTNSIWQIVLATLICLGLYLFSQTDYRRKKGVDSERQDYIVLSSVQA